MATVKSLLRKLERRHSPLAEPEAFERIVHDPDEPGAWGKLRAAMRRLRGEGRRPIVRRIVRPSASDDPAPPRPRPRSAPAPQHAERPKPAPRRSDDYGYLQTWTTDSLHLHARGHVPLGERVAIEAELHRRECAQYQAPPVSAEEHEAMSRRGGKFWFDRALGTWRRR